MSVNIGGFVRSITGKCRLKTHLTTAYIAGDGSANGCLEVYSQVSAPVHDLVLMVETTAADIHVVRSVGGTGQFFIGLPIKVSTTTLPSGLPINQDDNSTVMIFPSSGGRIKVTGTLEGDNGANDDLVLRNGNAAGLLQWLSAAGSAVFTISDVGTIVVSGNATITGALDHNGTTVGFFGVTPAARPTTYSATNVTVDRTYDANATTTDELADVLGTLIADLRTMGLVT